MKLIKKMTFVLFILGTTSFAAMENNKVVEELIVKDGKMVMIREGTGTSPKDYFFNLDKIAYVEKDTTKINTRFNIVLVNGKTITLFSKENYKKLMTTFLDMKKPIVNTPVEKKEIVEKKTTTTINSAQEQKEIDSMNIGNMEKIIALDPMDIKESK